MVNSDLKKKFLGDWSRSKISVSSPCLEQFFSPLSPIYVSPIEYSEYRVHNDFD